MEDTYHSKLDTYSVLKPFDFRGSPILRNTLFHGFHHQKTSVFMVSRHVNTI